MAVKESGPLSVPCADVAHKPVLGVRNKNMRIVRFFYFINSKGYLVREGEQIGISRDIDVQDPEMIGGTGRRRARQNWSSLSWEPGCTQRPDESGGPSLEFDD